jgi:Ser/Thr protein kinase RdoA (MazF antagonist)
MSDEFAAGYCSYNELTKSRNSELVILKLTVTYRHLALYTISRMHTNPQNSYTYEKNNFTCSDSTQLCILRLLKCVLFNTLQRSRNDLYR